MTSSYPSIGLIWVDGGYANVVDAGLIGWADNELGVRLEVVKRSDDVLGFHVLPRRWVVERTFGWLTRCRNIRSRRSHRSNYRVGWHGRSV